MYATHVHDTVGTEQGVVMLGDMWTLNLTQAFEAVDDDDAYVEVRASAPD